MSSDTPVPPDRAGSWSLSDTSSRDALQLIAEGVTELAGFGVAAIRVVRDDGLEVVAVAGSDEAREQLMGTRTPTELIEAEIEHADDWGPLRFVPHDRIDLDVETWGWVPDVEPREGPDAWHPMDALLAPLYDGAGTLRGLLSIDLPVDGRRPSDAQRRLLEKYAEQASRAVLTALAREELAEQVRLSNTARTIVRRASGQPSLVRVLEECGEALVDGFRALGMWIQTFDANGTGSSSVYASDGTGVELPRELVDMADRSARRAWDDQTVYVLSKDRMTAGLRDDQVNLIFGSIAGSGVDSILFVPLGAGPDRLGNLVLTRAADGPEWTETEASAALDIGHDLGGAILNARNFEREHRLVAELRALDTYKSQLIATVSHELKNPLTAIVGHLELLESAGEVSDKTRTSLAAMERGAQRLERVVDDLLLLSKVGDPANSIIPRPVDLRSIVDDVFDLTAVAAARRNLTVRVEAPPEPVVALGDADELDRLLTNLVSNAVKYTPVDRAITVVLARKGNEIVLSCQDEGIGISDADRGNLFREFFRSSNPVAVAQPGTGLGLAIVARIVERHHGRIEVESEIGVGSTFRVFLPAAPA
ncbi:MAG: ATP-binding region, ATPase domain protein [Nocardioides sp.]|nr:ATP-binding region, ATPase domain protein [Nocardioides sp.]